MMTKINLNNKNSLLEPVSYYLRDFDDTFYMTFHMHSYLEFMYCVKGEFNIEFYNSKGEYGIQTIKEKEIVFINTLYKHRLTIPVGVKPLIANIEFASVTKDPTPLQKTINYSLFFNDVLLPLMKSENGYFVLKDNTLIKTTLINLINVINNVETSDQVDTSMAIMEFFYSLKTSLDKRKEGQYFFIREAITYIKEHLAENLSIEQIAAVVNKSPSYFAHKFKEDRGVSVLKYINNSRIEKACFLLKHTSFSVSKIANEVGFTNKDQLNYQFHAIMNCTPSEYKSIIVYKQIENTSIGVYHSKDLDDDPNGGAKIK